ncbi:MAG: hypothetical protein PHN68_03590 [Prolixibacteraceae bacterium]|jgi:hypothetical protein|nr:hypothetical protein [Prolixibacteraceae bacterium]MDD4756679.1 hypothetical protein [Prolixibacteraceae bacterium]
MKTKLFLLFIFTSVFAFAQEDKKESEIRTLAGPKGVGFYVAGAAGYSQIESNDALIIGSRAGLIFNHSIAVGLAGYGFFNNLGGYHWPVGTEAWYSLSGGYGGIFIEPIIAGSKPVHVSFPVLFGMGGAGLVRVTGNSTWEDPFNISLPENDIFFIVEPAMDVELNLTNFLRTALSLSYRFTSNVELTGKAPDVLKGWHLGLIFKLGKF